MLTVEGSLDFILGHLKKGCISVTVERDYWESLTEHQQKHYLRTNGEIKVKEYHIDKIGDVVELSIKE